MGYRTSIMWVKQCHVYHPFSWEWFTKIPIKMVMTGGWLIYGIVLPTLTNHIMMWVCPKLGVYPQLATRKGHPKISVGSASKR